MTDIAMYDHFQQYRLDWYAAKKAVEENHLIDPDPHHAHMKFHLTTKQWVVRLLSTEYDGDGPYADIWHDRSIADYDGLKDTVDALRWETFNPEVEDPLDVDTLTKIGHAAEEIAVDAMDLPEQPPVDIDPWTPRSVSQIREELVEIREEMPADSHSEDNEF
ncbi:hypothetical protein [Salinibaculum salinum]|uniref:hypothetical protein n=1 Tax=Salinibaculum salinum TaxID=3131996 RepID=UPI0030EF3A86